MKERESNMELLRIVSMLLILVVHSAGASLGLPAILRESDLSNLPLTGKMAVESFSIIGVNCFVLISGYYGIRFKIKSLLKLCLMSIFYLFVIALTAYLALPGRYFTDDLFKAVIIFPFNDLWFIPAYIGLYICTPVINAVLDRCTKPMLAVITVLVIAVNIIFGWIMKCSFNPTGYTLSQMIMLYVAGRAVNRLELHKYIALTTSVTAWLMSTVLIFASCLYMPSASAFAYNSPFVLAASVFFFIIFTHLHFRSRAVNYIASSAFAVYLIHKSPVMWGLWFGFPATMRNLSATLSMPAFTAAAAAYIIAVFAACIIIDKLTFSRIARRIGL